MSLRRTNPDRRERLRSARRGIAWIAAFAVVGSTVVATEILTPTEQAAAQFATDGSGQYPGLIDWITWGSQGQPVVVGATGGTTRTIGGAELQTTCEIGAIGGDPGGVFVHEPGNFAGDALDDLYNVGGTGTANTMGAGLANAVASETVTIAVSCETTLDGTPVPMQGLVFAEAEASSTSGNEYVQATPDGPATWRVIERLRSEGCTTATEAVLAADGTLRLQPDGLHCGATPAGGPGPVAIAFMEGATGATFEVHGGGRSAVALGVVLGADFGDAPAGYGEAGAIVSPSWTGGELAVGTTNVFDGFDLGTPTPPSVPRLGDTVDAESGSQPSVDATGDGADEDGLLSIPAPDVERGDTYTLEDVVCTGPGMVAGWIDWNRNGQFDAGERSDAVDCTDGTVDLTWTVPEDAVSALGDERTFLRLRIAPDEVQLTATGLSTAGEVEDYAITVDVADAPLACPANAPGILFQGQPTQWYDVNLATGEYENVRTFGRTFNAIGYNQLDGNIYGYVSGSATPNVPWQIVRISGTGTVTNLGRPAGVANSVSYHVGDIDSNGQYWLSSGTLWYQIDLTAATPTVVDSGTITTPAGLSGPADWAIVPGNGDLLYQVLNRAATSQAVLVAFNPATGTQTVLGDLGNFGNNNLIGAVYADSNGFLYASNNSNGRIYRIDVENVSAELFAQGPISGTNDGTRCASSPIQIDFGDAPASYGTTLDDDGARHVVNGYDIPTRTADLMLGTTVDIEDDGQSSADASGDGLDEDGVSASIVLVIGQQGTVNVEVTNNRDEPATLAGWIDLDDDGVFEAGELQRVVVPANSGTTTQTLVFPAVGVPGDGTFARFRVLPGDVAAASLSPLGPVNGGEVEDYPVIGPVPVPDYGDAPDSYGTTAAADGAAHLLLDGPASLRLGALIDADPDGQPTIGADGDDLTGVDDEDGVRFNTEVSVPDRVETVFVTASGAGYLNAWIDFNLNGEFDTNEQIFTDEPVVTGVNMLRYDVPSGDDFVAGDSYARFRITSDPGGATEPTGLAPDGEVEDYTRALFDAPGTALQQCPAGTIPVPVSIIQNPSFEARTGDFANSGAASTIGFAEYWDDSHATGGQYHFFDPPAFDSGPGAATMPVRAGADGFAFEGGHSGLLEAAAAGEGATNVLAQALNPDATYVGFFSMAAGGYSREGDGYMNFYGTSDPDVGHYPGAGVVVPTAANTELLYSTPVVRYAGAGVDPIWEVHTFQLEAGQAWPYLRVEVRNETAANNATTAGQVWMNFDDFHMFECDPVQDFGDAPASYGTLLEDDGPRHTIVDHDAETSTAPIMLGASISTEDDGQPSADALGDGASDDGVVFNPGLGYTTPTLRTGLDPNTLGPVENTLEITASVDGFASVWVDWNQDGDFAESERVAHATPVTAGANDVTFAQGTNSDAISSFVRVRYSTDAASIATPTGPAPDGEVEDYRVLFERLVQPDTCVVSDTDYYALTFSAPINLTGTGGVGSTARYANVTVIDGVAVDMFAEVIAGQMQVSGGGAAPPNGFRVGDGASLGPDDAQWQIATDATIRYSFYEAGTTTPVSVSAAFTINDMDGPNVETATFSAADLVGYAVTEGSAVEITESGGDVIFAGGVGGAGLITQRFQVAFEGISSFDAAWHGGNGSGFGFDGDGDLSIQPPACSDFGDAPDSYGTTLDAEGARHLIVPGLRLGDTIDFDPDGQPSPGADADDLNRLADEDGVASEIILTVGQQTTVTVSATNDTAADATLAGWIDLDLNGTFDAGELITVVVPASSGTQNYQLVFPAGDPGADTYARFRLFPAGDAVSSTGAATGGEVEDYTVTFLETELEIEKTSDATVDSRPGDVITYTVTAENTGSGDFTAAFPAIVSDDLSGVLDDANYEGDAVAMIGGSDAGPVSMLADVLSWQGPLASGETVTITYSVTLGSDGDGEVRNVAWGGGGVTPACDPPVDGVDPVTGQPCAEHSFLLPRLTIEKSADTIDLPADGGTVNYTITVTNVGDGDYTVDAPAVVTDDLTDVLDDIAGSPTGLTAMIDGSPTTAPTFSSPELTWSGPLASGEVLEITYSVTYDDSTGDNSLRNVVCVDESEAAPGAAACDVVQIPGAGLTQWKQAEASDTPPVAGSTITYTVFFSNDGETDAAIDARDDLTHVLDDAVITTAPSSPDGLAVDLVGAFLGISGSVPVGATYTVQYTVTVLPDDERGDDIAANFLFDREPGGEFPPPPPGPDCTPTDEQFPDCTVTSIPAIEFEKSVEASTEILGEGTVLTYTVTVRNTGEATGTVTKFDNLSGVLDDADLTTAPSSDTPSVIVSSVVGGEFSIGGTLAAGGVAEITYQVTVLPQGERGDGVMQNFLLDPGEEPPAECLADDPECTSTELPFIVPSKSVDPVSGTDVAAGDVLTYTLSFENSGQAAGEVDFTDLLAGIVDDGVVSDLTVTSGPLEAELVGDEILVTGVLAAGETSTVTYVVTVGADGERGDNVLGNFLVVTGEVPPEECASEDPTCTSNDIAEIIRWKTVRASTDPVEAGTVLTYNVFVENIGEGAGEVSFVDDLTHVLDDADVTLEPSSAVLASPRTDSEIAISGTVAAGVAAVVTYEVTIREDGLRGDDIAANFLLEPGEEPPVDPVCEPGDGELADCTTTGIGNLAVTKSVVASTDPVGVGTELTYTLTFENVGEAPVTVNKVDDLSDVLDDATLGDAPVADDAALTVSAVVDDAFTVTGELAVGQAVTVEYSVIVNPITERGNDSASNFVLNPGEEPPAECDPAVAPCTVTDLPRVVASKSVDPVSGTDVAAGDVLTYTLSFENSGQAAGEVDFTDLLAGIVDDGVVSDLTVTSGPLVAQLVGDEILVTGVLAAGETSTVTYVVTVGADGERGDNVLGNFLVVTGEVPPEECASEDPTCTSNDIAEIIRWKTVTASTDPVEAGTVLTYNVFVENIGEGAGEVSFVDDLTHVLDDADVTVEPTSGILTSPRVNEEIAISGTLAAGVTAVVTYEVTIREDGLRGDDIAANFLLEPGEEPPVDPECEPADGELPECTTTGIGHLAVAKSVAASTDPVGAGTELTYTLTFENIGTAPVTVDKVDDLSGVLDDATLEDAPVASDAALTVSGVVDDAFTVTGELAAGQVVTVEYSVIVNPITDRGDDSAANFVLNPGEEPPAECDPAVAPCTVTDLPRIVTTKAVEASTDPIAPGTVLRYTITFENLGLAVGAVDKVDDLSGVLDDAELSLAPVANDAALTASPVVDDEFSVTGTLVPGQLVEVTYEVTVRDDSDRGDNQATNFVLDPGQTPPTECDPEVAPCTVTNMPELHDSKSVNPVSGTPVVAGQQLTYTLTFRNDGTAEGFVNRVDDLTHVLDDADLVGEPTASDAALTVTGPDSGNQITVMGMLQPGQVVTVEYTVEVRASGERGDDVIANFVLDPGEEPPLEPICEPASDEDPNCTRNEVGEILPTKSSNPVSFTDVTDGTEITYTLRFENVGAGAATVDYVDYLGAVLDDAQLVDEPAADAGLTATGPTGGEITVTGTVAAGAVATVTYTVVVLPYGEQGDHLLGNFLVLAGFDPPTLCDPADPLCTLHEVPPPPAGLALTGSTVGVAALVALALLTGGALALLVRRQRRRAHRGA